MNQIIAVERVDHIGIRVRNLDRALNFYRVLGFELLHQAEGNAVAILRNENGVELNLLETAFRISRKCLVRFGARDFREARRARSDRDWRPPRSTGARLLAPLCSNSAV
jgi:catechol 2,3-dioxygenase-like lactoylglutathione lyase family enzyme